jgi:hypothetical protein
VFNLKIGFSCRRFQRKLSDLEDYVEKLHKLKLLAKFLASSLGGTTGPSI